MDRFETGDNDVRQPFASYGCEVPRDSLEVPHFLPTQAAANSELDHNQKTSAADNAMEFFTENFELTPAQRESLNNVNLRFHFGNHAYPDTLLDHGRVELAVDDRDFAGMEAVGRQLNPARGDVLAREAHGYDRPWDLHTWLETLLEWELLTIHQS